MGHGTALSQANAGSRRREISASIFRAHGHAIEFISGLTLAADAMMPEPLVHRAGATAARPRMVAAAGLSDVGSVRSHNEDSYVIAELEGAASETKGSVGTLEVRDAPVLLMVADGVGGAASGEIASMMATDIVLTELRGRLGRPSESYGSGLGLGLRAALQAANAAIHEHARSNTRHRGMATTATVAVIHDQTIFLAQIGDSRAYLVRRGVARQLTKDQSLIQRLIDVGELTEDEAAASDRRNIILQAVGSEAVLAPDLSAEPLADGDVVILCSDGLSNLVPADDIARAVAESFDLARLCQRLVRCANERGGDDNITVVAARYNGGSGDDVAGGGAPLDVHTGPGSIRLARAWRATALAAVALALLALAIRIFS